MTLRQMLNELTSHTNEDFTEEQLLDLEVYIDVPHSCGQYCIYTAPLKVSIAEEKHLSKSERRDVSKRKIVLNTSLIS